MLGHQGVAIKLSEAAMDFLADKGYDPQFGARPLKRVLQRDVINELSKQMLSGSFAMGDTIYIDADGKGKLTFSEKPFKEKSSNGKSEVSKKKIEKEKVDNNKKDKEREKDLEKLKKATKDVEDAVKDMKNEEGKDN